MPLHVIFMDAGQGDATLLVYPDGSAVLVDCGSRMNKDIVSEQIEMVLSAQLPAAPGKKSHKKLRALVLTHPDGDHYNLVNELIVDKGVQVDNVFAAASTKDYVELDDWLKSQNTTTWTKVGKPNKPVPHHSDAVVGGLSCYPAKGGAVEVRILAANVVGDRNTGSIVLLVTYANVNLLLMGDGTKVTEAAILDNFKGQAGSPVEGLLRSKTRQTFLKVGHHGSATSSSEPWITWTRPSMAFVSSDTKTFRGTSIPRKEILDGILATAPIKNDMNKHYYVQYDSASKEHELAPSAGPTKRAMFTTLHRLKWQDHLTFKAYGTSWYLVIDDTGQFEVKPACGWDEVCIHDPRPL